MIDLFTWFYEEKNLQEKNISLVKFKTSFAYVFGLRYINMLAYIAKLMNNNTKAECESSRTANKKKSAQISFIWFVCVCHNLLTEL